MAKGYTHIRDNETTLHEQPRRVSNLAQGFIIRWQINESAYSNQRHIIVSSGDRHKSETPNMKTKFNTSRKHVIINSSIHIIFKNRRHYNISRAP